MSNYRLKAVSTAAAMLLLAGGAWAQTPATTNPAATGNPATVGVTPQDAKEANQKAVPRTDTGTLVRTEPSAAARASDMAKDAKTAVTPTTSNNSATNSTTNMPAATNSTPVAAPMTGNANSMQTGTTNMQSASRANSQSRANRRAARADRN